MPSWVRTVSVPRHEGGARQITVDSQAALVWAANLTGEFHTVQWRAAAPRVADRLVVDIDPGPGMDLLACRDGALLVRDRLAADGLTVHVKLSGSKGLHLLVGLEPTPSDQVSAYARRVAQDLERERPELFTAVMAKTRRTGRLFLDWSQNNAAKTTAAPYTVRANTVPTVSAPVTWEELEQAHSVRDWRSRSIRCRTGSRLGICSRTCSTPHGSAACPSPPKPRLRRAQGARRLTRRQDWRRRWRWSGRRRSTPCRESGPCPAAADTRSSYG
jgi:DNA ligase D-like protein (predicted polymerase)